LPFIRFMRDKRGYESTLVMHAYRPMSGAQHGRVLYVFRTPSNLKVGRRALDDEVTEALEHTHPDLTFDWVGLLRDPGMDRSEPREPHRRPPPRRPSAPAPPVPAPAPALPDDPSVLGRTLGAEAAARLRARFDALMQRVARRARTTEERDRLLERAGRLNPHEWSDPAAVQAGAAAAEREWDAIAAELPSRRRGRRGGRSRGDARPGPAGAGDTGVALSGPATGEAPAEPSGIMEQGDAHDIQEPGGAAREHRPADGAGDSGVERAERAETDPAPESDDPAARLPGDG
jgi:hypothetical protein